MESRRQWVVGARRAPCPDLSTRQCRLWSKVSILVEGRAWTGKGMICTSSATVSGREDKAKAMTPAQQPRCDTRSRPYMREERGVKDRGAKGVEEVVRETGACWAGARVWRRDAQVEAGAENESRLTVEVEHDMATREEGAGDAKVATMPRGKRVAIRERSDAVLWQTTPPTTADACRKRCKCRKGGVEGVRES